jgi:hypothetical protein
MDKKHYYNCLARVPGADGNVNAQWAVVKKTLPFKELGDAVKFACEVYGEEYEPGSDTVTVDSEMCKERALVLCPEVQRLRDAVDSLIKKNDAELHRKAEQRDSLNVVSLKEQVEKDLLEERIHEMIGTSTGLHEVWQMLNKRQYELWECTRYAGKG